MFPEHARIENRFERISYSVSDEAVAVETQGGNLNAEKVRIALEHALALWGVGRRWPSGLPVRTRSP